MRKLLLALAFLAVVGLAALTPRQASAFGYRGYYNSGYYYPSYYVPSYYGPAYYAPGYYAPNYYVAPVVSNYYAPAYGVVPAATTYYENYSYSPYYGPRYDRSFAFYAPGGYIYHR
jgi:hypothetical protein